MSYLLLFTITPVQDFIVQSRKLKDLFGSSDILSCMSEIGMKICKREGGEFIFPLLQEKEVSYPNRFLVEFKDKRIEEIKNIAKDIEDKLLKFLRGLNDLNHPKIYEHLENYFTFYWAVSEIESNYKSGFDKVEKLLAGAKNTRFFNQLGNGEGEKGRKCSICGERNVVIYNGKLKFPKEQYENDKPKKNKIAQKNEGLCGVCYVKRRYGDVKKGKFDSTADIALMHIFEKVKRKEFRLLNKNSQLFFRENLTEKYLKEQGLLGNKKLEDFLKEWEKFNKLLKEKNFKQTSYYAVIMFDGDSMGEWLSGKNLNADIKEFHRFMSKRLSLYSMEAKEIVKFPKGEAVYAGGDDFLGFVNLNYLFEVLKDLREKWDEIVNKLLQENFELKKDFTFSAGVVVAHYKTPLAYVLGKVREAEKTAKEFNNKRKNAITFTVLKRSGEIRKASIGFEKLDNLVGVQKRLKNYSDSFISKLEKEFSLMNEVDWYMVEVELRRLLKKSEIFDDEIVEKLDNLFENFNDFSHLLNFIKFLNREVQ